MRNNICEIAEIVDGTEQMLYEIYKKMTENDE